MHRRLVSIFIIILFSLCIIVPSIAGERGNARKGKYIFRSNCRPCHRAGGKARPMGPYQRKIKEWESIFAKDKYKEFKCKNAWEKLSQQELLDMLQYMRDGAIDSKVPRGCG